MKGWWMMRASMLMLAVAFLAFSADARDGDVRSSTHRVDSRLVLVPVTVTDRNGKTVTDLKREQFQVLDNSAPVDIVSFGREEAPVSLGIVLDLSGSMRAKRNQAVSAIREIVNAAGPQDEAFLVTFSSAPAMRVEFTSDLDAIVHPLYMAGARGSTALVDAMYMGLQQMKRARNPRRALIVLSDGGDNNSRYTEAELSSFALESNTQIYSISIHESATNVEEQAGVFLLSKLSETTGGLHFIVRDRRDLPEIAARLATAVNNLYVIGYRPSEEFLSGKWRSLKVKVESAAGQRLRVASRTGYFPD